MSDTMPPTPAPPPVGPSPFVVFLEAYDAVQSDLIALLVQVASTGSDNGTQDTLDADYMALQSAVANLNAPNPTT